MVRHTHILDQASQLYSKLQREMMERYGIEAPLASEMALDFLEIIVAVDGDVGILEKYILH